MATDQLETVTTEVRLTVSDSIWEVVVVSDYLVLAADRTKRLDIFRSIMPYHGGWTVADPHYWAGGCILLSVEQRFLSWVLKRLRRGIDTNIYFVIDYKWRGQ